MRLRLALLTALAPSLACFALGCEQPLPGADGSGDGSGDIGDETGSTTSHITGGGGCATSRQKLLSAASSARRKAIERGFKWLDDNVPYSQSASHEGYRTDCSGFV